MVTKAATASEQTAKAEEFASSFNADMTKTLILPQPSPSVHEALSAVMEQVQAVGKTGRNQQQGYSFRGVDAVVNAVGPALRAHGVVVTPHVEDCQLETYTTKSGTVMRSCVLRVRYVFTGPLGDELDCTVYGESSDAGDKAVPKAHSVAFRTALLQALCIPTDEPDPDEQTHERGAPAEPVLPDGWKSWDELNTVWNTLKAVKDALPDEEKAEVDAWVKAHGITRGTFTAANARDLDRLLPASTPAKAEPPAESLPLETT